MKTPILILLVLLQLIISCGKPTHHIKGAIEQKTAKKPLLRTLADTSGLGKTGFDAMVRYGYNLFINTPKFIGQDGLNGAYLGNHMSCGNCHLDGGTRQNGLSLHSTYGRYPQYRARENKVLTIEARINNCIERPHNGKPLPLESEEMLALVCYIKWIGEGVPLGAKPKGSGLVELPFLERAADPVAGEKIFMESCASCHGKNGEGQMELNAGKYQYPPLWGANSFQDGSSMQRLLKMTSFVYHNMPFDKVKPDKPYLTLEQAYDVCAFVLDPSIHERPKPLHNDHGHENLENKPIDYPKGPYPDTFSEIQHRLGPYPPILQFHEKNKNK